MHPVLEIYVPDGIALWPVAEIEPFSDLSLSGKFSPPRSGQR